MSRNRKLYQRWLTAFPLLALMAACGPSASSAKVKADTCGLLSDKIGTFVEIPSGSFLKGTSPLYPEEAPSLRLQVNGFTIQSHEVTNALSNRLRTRRFGRNRRRWISSLHLR
jgi:formylglycine-generating enzyme required for sulfatase activity